MTITDDHIDSEKALGYADATTQFASAEDRDPTTRNATTGTMSSDTIS